ncbi:unnamed protein product [Rotaria magnacalcarata]
MMASDVSLVSRFYLFDNDLKLGEENFADIVNKNILCLLYNEAGKNAFEDDVFRIFNHILVFENDYQANVIKILQKYSANKYLIPDETMLALENVISIPEWFDQVFKVFESMIYNKQSVSEKILQIIADYFYLSHDKKLRDRSFHLLTMVDDNQDVSDEIFDILELEKASLVISSNLSDANHAIVYLFEKTKEGKRLTINGFKALSKVIDNRSKLDEEILKIILNTSTNEQIITDDLIQKLVKRFKPDKVQKHLLEIFENLVKNNQDIPNELSFKLTKALDNSRICDQVLFIFILEGQKGKKLSENIIRKILDKVLKIENPLAMQQYLSVICSVIEETDYFEYNKRKLLNRIFSRIFGNNIISKVQTTLLHALKTDNQDVIRKSISGFKTLISIHQVELENQVIEVLVSLTTSARCDESMKQDISTLLNKSKLDENQQLTYKLSYLNYNSDEQLLDNLAKFPQLLTQHFNQINLIIDNCSELTSKALETLLKCSNKKNIPDKLLDSIAVLLASTNSETIKSLCCRLLAEIVKAGRQVTDEIISLILVQDEKKKPIDILKLICKNQIISEELKTKINLFSDIDSTTNIDRKTLHKFLNNMRQEFQISRKFSHLSIQKLLSFNISLNGNETKLEQDLIDIFALILIQNPEYSENQFIVNCLEKAILSKTINEKILNAYKEVIKRTKCQTKNFESVLDIFIEILNKSDSSVKTHFDILVCIALASESKKITKLETLENNIFNDNEIIRSWSFRGLRAAYDRGLRSLEFQQWCDSISEKMEENTPIEVSFDFDLFETISALKYIDFDKICDKPQNQWNIELLIFDLIERISMSEAGRFQFYQAWLDIEEHQKGNSNILLKLLHRFVMNNGASFHECYETINILDKIDFEIAYRILLNSNDAFVSLKTKYLTVIIKQRLLNKNGTSCEYIESLALKMISKFGLDISQKLFDALENINNLAEFENIVNFAKENKIKLSDIYVKKATIPVLKRTLEIKFLGGRIKGIDRLKLGTYLDSLLDQSWTFEQLHDFFNIVNESNSQDRARYSIFVLEIILHYKIFPKKENYDKISTALKNSAESWLKEINKIAVEATFSDRIRVKTSRELIQEFESGNSHIKNLKNLGEEKLRSLIEKIKSSNLFSEVLKNISQDRSNANNQIPSICISQWTKNHILQWADIVKANIETRNTNSEDFIVEALAVIKQANFIETRFHLTDAQILSCLIILNANKDQGRLLQLATGEGNSTIISALAVFYALQGKKVDIITSSPVLAERDAKEKEKFYHMFDLQCSHKNDKVVYLSGPKTCYKEQVVYDEAAQFQFDTLRTEDSSKIARLATSISDMDQLQIIYHLLWNQLISMQDKIIQLDGELYLLYGKIKLEQNRISLEYVEGVDGFCVHLQPYPHFTDQFQYIKLD